MEKMVGVPVKQEAITRSIKEEPTETITAASAGKY